MLSRVMHPFVFACIAPHGAEIVEELSGSNLALMERTRAAMRHLERVARESAPEALIVLTPHGTRVEGQFSVTDCERVLGEVDANGASWLVHHAWRAKPGCRDARKGRSVYVARLNWK